MIDMICIHTWFALNYHETGVNYGSSSRVPLEAQRGVKEGEMIARFVMVLLNVLFLGVASSWPSVVHAIDSPKLGTELRLENSSTGTLMGTAVVTVEQQWARAGEALKAEVQFRWEAGGGIFDPFFSSGDPARASLRVFDASGRFVGNALHEVRCDVLLSELWVAAQPGTVMGRRICLPTGIEANYRGLESVPVEESVRPLHLGIGKYSLQLVLHGRFLDTHLDGGLTPRSAQVNHDKEICRSHPVEVEVLPRFSSEPVAPDQRCRSEVNLVQQLRRLTEAQDLRLDQDKVPLVAKLEIDNPRVPPDQMTFTILVANVGETPLTVFNPLFGGLVQFKTADLLAFDRNGNQIGTLLKTGPHDGSSMIRTNDWLKLPPGGIVGVRRKVLYYSPTGPIERGAYLQVVFYDTFLSESPFAGLSPASPFPKQFSNPLVPADARISERWKQWHQDHPGKELFRSNSVKLIVGN
jgi:hypothetical protein